MPDRDAPSPDALDVAMDDMMIAAAMYPFRGPEVTAARAAVRKAAREMGEEYTVGAVSLVGQFIGLIGTPLQAFDVVEGDRVRVVKVTE